jgi:uncharacterized membrane protein
LALFLAVLEVTFEQRTVFESFFAFAVLQIISPHAFVSLTSLMRVRAHSVCLVVFEISLILVTVCVEKDTSAVSSVETPVALVSCIVLPNLDTFSVLDFNHVVLNEGLFNLLLNHASLAYGLD